MNTLVVSYDSCHSLVSYLVSKGTLAAACVTSQAATVDHQRRRHIEMVEQLYRGIEVGYGGGGGRMHGANRAAPYKGRHFEYYLFKKK